MAELLMNARRQNVGEDSVWVQWTLESKYLRQNIRNTRVFKIIPVEDPNRKGLGCQWGTLEETLKETLKDNFKETWKESEKGTLKEILKGTLKRILKQGTLIVKVTF